MDTNEHASSQTRRGARSGCGVGLVTRYCDLELRRRGAVAHMSLHQKPTMSKSHRQVKADSYWFPDLHRGIRLSVRVGDRRGGERLNRQRRVGGAHLGAARDSVNGFLQFSFKKCVFARDRLKTLDFMWGCPVIFQGRDTPPPVPSSRIARLIPLNRVIHQWHTGESSPESRLRILTWCTNRDLQMH